MIDSRSSSSAQRLSFWSQFPGKERDAETGLDYFGARYYSGAQGRFISVDPIGIMLLYPQIHQTDNILDARTNMSDNIMR
ncbi:MAG: hypothetical protein JXA73_22355 [Acidobacteria bacterium]|nr:hypothetical protein [Acidobacteriota bacterium]